MASALDERTLRLFAAAEAEAIGYGGVSRLARITGLARSTIGRGQVEISNPAAVSVGRVRRPGGGRKRACDSDPSLVVDLERLLEPLARGDPMSPLRWTCKSIRMLAAALVDMGHAASHRLVWTTLRELKYSLQGNRKMQEGNQHPDRNGQFEHINASVTREMRRGNPVISVDTKKKELVGNYKNEGRIWHEKGGALRVQGHDFPHPDVPRAYPYGIYDRLCLARSGPESRRPAKFLLDISLFPPYRIEGGRGGWRIIGATPRSTARERLALARAPKRRWRPGAA